MYCNYLVDSSTVCYQSGEIAKKSLSSTWQHLSCLLLDEEIPKICQKLNYHDGLLRADQGRAKYAIIWAELAMLFSRQLKTPSRELNFQHIFEILLSSRHEKCCQMLERPFVLFHHSRNIPWQSLSSSKPAGSGSCKTKLQ